MGSKVNSIRVRIIKINKDNGVIECAHLNSGLKIKAIASEGMELEEGQIVLIEYVSKQGKSNYIIVDDLIEELEATILEAHHIISDGIMYTSIIIENPMTHVRMHSLVPSYDKLFSNTNILIKGDVVKMKFNNGKIFSLVENGNNGDFI